MSSPSHPGSSGARRRISSTKLLRLTRELSERDLDVLRTIAAHRFATTVHVQGFHFADHTSNETAARATRRTLERLRDAGLLDTLERRVGGIRAGSASFVWHLTSGGDRLLGAIDGRAIRRFHEPSQRLLDHSLMVVDIHLALLTSAPVEVVRVELEPDSWRTYTGLGGEPHLVRPDLAAVTASGDYEDHWMFEADTGSEHPPTVVRAARRYERYFATGIEQQDRGVTPRVIWIVPHEKRAARLREAFEAAKLDPEVFGVVTLDDLPAMVAGDTS